MKSRVGSRLRRLAAPAAVGLFVLAAWEALVRLRGIPSFVLPGPVEIVDTLIRDRALLLPALASTLRTTLLALLAAVGLGGAMAVVLSLSRGLERSLFPYAVILQVTPVVSIAPLIILWVGDAGTALLVCAWLVAFFPVLANTMIGLNAVDPDLADLFRLYRASTARTVLLLRLPTALPYFLAGLRISGGLALIGAVVAEFVAGSAGTDSGLAWRILEAGYQLRIPRMFAALLLISLSGVAIHLATSGLSRLLLRRRYDVGTDRDG